MISCRRANASGSHTPLFFTRLVVSLNPRSGNNNGKTKWNIIQPAREFSNPGRRYALTPHASHENVEQSGVSQPPVDWTAFKAPFDAYTLQPLPLSMAGKSAS